MVVLEYAVASGRGDDEEDDDDEGKGCGFVVISTVYVQYCTYEGRGGKGVQAVLVFRLFLFVRLVFSTSLHDSKDSTGYLRLGLDLLVYDHMIKLSALAQGAFALV